MLRGLLRQGAGRPRFGPFACGFSEFGAARGSFDAFLVPAGRSGSISLGYRFTVSATSPFRLDRPVAIFQDLSPSSPLLPPLVHDVIFPRGFTGFPSVFLPLQRAVSIPRTRSCPASSTRIWLLSKRFFFRET